MDKAELRMSVYKGHVDHAKTWKYNPVDWHTWKFRVWPEYDFDVPTAVATVNLILFAARVANKKISIIENSGE